MRMSTQMEEPNSPSPEIIRMSCTLCRRRKLKCNRQVPSCDSCIKLQQECVYGVVRIKKATRKDRTQTLEGRLAQIERLLRINDTKKPKNGTGRQPSPASQPSNDESAEVEEDTVRELENIFFEKIHPSLPMLHRERYMQSTGLEPEHQPPIFLRHAIWALAASVSPEHYNLEAPLCYSARKYLEDAELRDAHLDAIGVTHVQTWVLISSLESRNIHLHRLWMSTGRAVRMAQLMGLFRIDKVGIEKGEEEHAFDHLSDPKDWIEREEWRRTFWMTFCLDRYGSMGTCWPMSIDDRDIETLLPCDEEAFQSGRETISLSLAEGMTPQGCSSLSPYSALIVITAQAARKLQDLKRVQMPDFRQSRDTIGAFLQQSSWLESMLSTIFIPHHLRMPSATKDPLVIFLNMISHSSTIQVTRMALAKAGDEALEETVIKGQRQCLEAAAAITNCMRGQSIMDLSTVHPFTSFCLCVAANTYATSISADPSPTATSVSTTRHHIHSLSFLMMSMNSLKAVNPLVNAFIKDLYRDFPTISEWLNSSISTDNVDNLLPLNTSQEGEEMAWDSQVGFLSRFGFDAAVKKHEEKVVDAEVAAMGPELGVGIGVENFNFEFEGMGIRNAERVGGESDLEFLGSTDNPADWNFMNDP